MPHDNRALAAVERLFPYGMGRFPGSVHHDHRLGHVQWALRCGSLVERAGRFSNRRLAQVCLLLEQIPPLFGAGEVFEWGPAPRIGLLRSPVAQVTPLFPHLRQLPPVPAPAASYTCAIWRSMSLPSRKRSKESVPSGSLTQWKRRVGSVRTARLAAARAFSPSG